MIGRLVGLLAVAVLGTACGMSRNLAERLAVDFSLDRVADLRVAGLDLSRQRSFDELTPPQVAVIAAAARAGNVPVDFNLVVRARNPSLNSATAEVFALEWTLVLNERDTITGRFDRRTQIGPGRVVELPIPIRLNLAQFFGHDEHELIAVLKATIGDAGMPLNLALRTIPSVGTAYGPIGSRTATVITRRVGTGRE